MSRASTASLFLSRADLGCMWNARRRPRLRPAQRSYAARAFSSSSCRELPPNLATIAALHGLRAGSIDSASPPCRFRQRRASSLGIAVFQRLVEVVDGLPDFRLVVRLL